MITPPGSGRGPAGASPDVVAERVEAACSRAVTVGARSYRHVEAMLKHGLDRLPLDTTESSLPRPGHADIRGPAYSQQEIPHAD